MTLVTTNSYLTGRSETGHRPQSGRAPPPTDLTSLQGRGPTPKLVKRIRVTWSFSIKVNVPNDYNNYYFIKLPETLITNIPLMSPLDYYFVSKKI